MTVALRGMASGQNILENCMEREKQNCYLFRCRLLGVLGVIAPVSVTAARTGLGVF